ncbi:MAG: hypothetical protein JJ975_03775 [Bacteroidia bacterium]|nr:hypothetical protein [Bacteroidia bacterium]
MKIRQFLGLIPVAGLLVYVLLPKAETPVEHQSESLNDTDTTAVASVEIKLDTSVFEHTAFDVYHIKLVNYFENDTITGSRIEMKDYVAVDYQLDTLLHRLFDHPRFEGLSPDQISRIKIISNTYGFIRGNNIYWEAVLYVDGQTHKIRYALTYRGQRKGRFWHNAGLLHFPETG